MKQIQGVLLISFLLCPLIFVKAASQDEVYSAIRVSFQAIERAKKAGGNISSEIELLNQATALVKNGGDNNLAEAIRICEEVSMKAKILEEQNLETRNTGYLQTAAITIALLVLALIINKFGSKLYFSIWESLRGNWRIERA